MVRIAHLLLFWLLSTYATGQFCGKNYDVEVEDIVERAAQLEGAKPRLVLVGSSSIRKWNGVESLFGGYEVVNAGFGGSCYEDLWRYREKLIYGLQPDVLFIYEGDNDLVSGRNVEEVVEVASILIEEISETLPSAKVVLISSKPSIARYELFGTYLDLNEELRSMAGEQGCEFVDFWNVMHDDDGRLRKELFVSDGVHLNDAGYGVWVDELRRVVPWVYGE